MILRSCSNPCFSAASDTLKVVNDFNTALSVSFTDHLLPVGDTYTFRNAACSAFSFIDHFFISNHLLSNIMSLKIVDSGVNLSDHIPLCLVFLCK